MEEEGSSQAEGKGESRNLGGEKGLKAGPSQVHTGPREGGSGLGQWPSWLCLTL